MIAVDSLEEKISADFTEGLLKLLDSRLIDDRQAKSIATRFLSVFVIRDEEKIKEALFGFTKENPQFMSVFEKTVSYLDRAKTDVGN
ncbi:hypothetical protein HY214_04015 [Candidatus Roizmanbacteria bacterium]|nr:hypothetical protein [Candidatus Roizmanbacteria bacterium]